MGLPALSRSDRSYQLSGSGRQNVAAYLECAYLQAAPQKWAEILLPGSQLVNMNLSVSGWDRPFSRPDSCDATAG